MKTTKGGFVGFVATQAPTELSMARLESLAGTVSLLVKQVRELEKQIAELKTRQTRDKTLWARLKESVLATEENQL